MDMNKLFDRCCFTAKEVTTIALNVRFHVKTDQNIRECMLQITSEALRGGLSTVCQIPFATRRNLSRLGFTVAHNHESDFTTVSWPSR